LGQKKIRSLVLNKLRIIFVAHNGKDARRGKCFAKFVLCTNNETGFAPLTSADTRFWVIKVSPFEGAEDTEIEEKMKDEIHVIIHYSSIMRVSSFLQEYLNLFFLIIVELPTLKALLGIVRWHRYQ
jgi:hypothetical protein